MTSSLLRKLRTTPSSTPTWTRAETLRTACAAAVMLLACASAVFGGRNTPSTDSATEAGSTSADTDEDPLDRLRARSARKRWGSQDRDKSATTEAPTRAPWLRNQRPARDSVARRSGSSSKQKKEETEVAPAVPPPSKADEQDEVTEIVIEDAPVTRKPAANHSSLHQRPVANPAPALRQPAVQEEVADASEDAAVVTEDAEPVPAPRATRAPHATAKPMPRGLPADVSPADIVEIPEASVLPQVPHAAELLPRNLGTARRVPQAMPMANPRLVAFAQARNTTPSEPIRDPRLLPKISTIKPFADYEPDPERLKDDRCHNLCPRPNYGCPDCKKGEDGKLQCPDCPDEVRLSQEHLAPRNFGRMDYCWAPTDLWSYPLYFEDPDLERYGHTRGCLQPLWSVGRFGVQLFGLPYQMTIDPICKKRYALGYYRPGACVPYKYTLAPWNTEAALVEAGVLTGAYYLFAP